MSYPAVPGKGLRCPWCDSTLPIDASECPSCSFPFRPDAPSRPAPADPLPTLAVDLGAHERRSQAHRLRMLAGVLALVGTLIVVSGVGVAISLNDPTNRQDRQAAAGLYGAYRQARGDPSAGDAGVTLVGADEASTGPSRVSVAHDGQRWFAAIRSATAHCLALGAVIGADGGVSAPGVLPAGDACTGSVAARRLSAVVPQPAAKG